MFLCLSRLDQWTHTSAIRKAWITTLDCDDTQKHTHPQCWPSKEAKYKSAAVQMSTHLSQCFREWKPQQQATEKGRFLSGFTVPAFWTQQVSVWDWQSEEPHSRTSCSTGWLLPIFPTSRILPALRRPKSQNKSEHASELQVSWHSSGWNISLRILKACWMASLPPGTRDALRARQQLRHFTPEQQSEPTM